MAEVRSLSNPVGLRKEHETQMAIAPDEILLVTHAHIDHIGDVPAIARLNNTRFCRPADKVPPLTGRQNPRHRTV